MTRIVAVGEEFEVRTAEDLIHCTAPRFIRDPSVARLLAASLVAAAAVLDVLGRHVGDTGLVKWEDLPA